MMKTRPIVAGVTKGASQRREDKSRPADRYRRMKDGGSSNRRGGGTTEMAEIVGEEGNVGWSTRRLTRRHQSILCRNIGRVP